MKLHSLLLLSSLFLCSRYNIPVSANQKSITKTNTVNSFTTEDLKTSTFSRLISFPLQDGVNQVAFGKVTDKNHLSKSPYLSLTLPVSMFDGDANYTVNISSTKPSSQYNIALIVDTSSNMSDRELQVVKDSYINLINYLVDRGLGENSIFAVISFNSGAISQSNLTAARAIAAIQKLKLSNKNNSQAKYDEALKQADEFIDRSPLDKNKVENIVYFLAKNQFQSNNNHDIFANTTTVQQLQKYAHIKAFGIEGDSDAANKSFFQQLNYIDSDRAIAISQASELQKTLMKSEMAGSIAEVKILLEGKVVHTIAPEQFVDTPLGLTYRSSIDGLDISANAENKVTAEVTFNNGLPTKSIDYIVTSGQSTGASYGSQPGSLDNILFGSDRSDKIVLGAADLGANGGAGNDSLVANRRDNILNGGIGNDTIIAHKGDDTITTGKGRDFVDGGDGIDTVMYENKSYQGSLIRKVGKIINVNGADTLTDIEFMQFSDVRISVATLEIIPILKVQPKTRVKEGDFKNTTVQLTFELSTPASSDVQFSYNTVTFEPESSYEAVANRDYIAKSGKVVIPRGETKATLNFEVIGNTIDEENDLRPFFVRLANISGATFEENQEESGVAIYIEDDDNAF